MLIIWMDKQKLIDATKPPFNGISIADTAKGMQNNILMGYRPCCSEVLSSQTQTSINEAVKYVYSLKL
jgi:hypothetical protein